MGNHFNKHTNLNNVYLSVSLQKNCYFPSEIITANLTLSLKNTEINSQLTLDNPLINITLLEETALQIPLNSFDKFSVSYLQNRQIISQSKFEFPELKNKTIPLNLSICFKIPENIYPTFLIDEGVNFIKHFLKIEIPFFHLTKKILIIIKNKKRYIKDNDLYKEQLCKFRDKSHLLKKNSKIYYLIKTEKNSYAYNEMIPYKIIINCSDSKLFVKYFRVSLIRKIIYGNYNEVKTEKITFKEYDINEKNNINNSDRIYKFSDFLNLKENNPIKIYDYYNNKILLKNLKEEIYPTCISNVLTCCYFLFLEIFYYKFILNDEIELPIDMYSPGEEEDIKTIKKIEQNEITPDETFEKTPDEICAEDFEILDHEEFSKILCDEIEKN